MPAIPGALGLAAFAGVKFAGYMLAGTALKRLHKAIVAGPIKIAAVRTGLGILLGLPISVGSLFLLENFAPKGIASMPPYALYFLVACIRVLIWALVIWIFTRQAEIAPRRLWLFALVGALWSCFLDLPGILLAVVAPGQIPIC
jgi:hypothetical protein